MVIQQNPLKFKHIVFFRSKPKLGTSATVYSCGVEVLWTVTAVAVFGDCWSSSILTAQREKRFRATEISFCKSNSVCLIQDSRWFSCHLYNLEFSNYINRAAEETCIKHVWNHGQDFLLIFLPVPSQLANMSAHVIGMFPIIIVQVFCF